MIVHILNGTFGNGNTGIRDYVFTFYVLEERREPIVYGSNIHSLGCEESHIVKHSDYKFTFSQLYSPTDQNGTK